MVICDFIYAKNMTVEGSAVCSNKLQNVRSSLS